MCATFFGNSVSSVLGFLSSNDPAVKGGLTFEIYPMPGAVVRKSETIQAVKSMETYRKGSSFFSNPK
jgi:hypothetical protein